MAQITTLKDKEGKTLYPITSSKAVFDENGVDIETRVNGKVEKVPGKVLSSNDYTDEEKQKLDALPTNEELTQQLGGKQGALEDSEDVTVDGDKLTVTERAKRQLFIDMWNKEAGADGGYNEQTGFFELNGLTDITYEQALLIYRHSRRCSDGSSALPFLIDGDIRTNFPIWSGNLGFYLFESTGNNFEVLAMSSGATGFTLSSWSLSNRARLREIRGEFKLKDIVSNSSFIRLPALQEIRIKELKISVAFKDSPLLSLESLQYLIENATNTSAITVTVHKNIYAKLTGDTTNEAYNDLTDEEKEQWTALVPLALEKNIQFATT